MNNWETDFWKLMKCATKEEKEAFCYGFDHYHELQDKEKHQENMKETEKTNKFYQGR